MTKPKNPSAHDGETSKPGASEAPPPAKPELVPEIGGRKGPDPTRFGDWEKDGRCIDF